MKTLLVSRKCFMFIVVTLLIGFGTQGSYGQTIAASTPQPLTEITLHGSVVTLTLSGGTYEQWIRRGTVMVSGIDGVTFGVERVNGTEVTIELEYAGNIDADGTLTFTVGAGAIAGYNGSALTATVPVTAVEESLDASTASPLTEANLHGSVVTLTLTGRNYERSGFTIERALTISGIDGVTFERYNVNRVSDTEVTIELEYAGNIDADGTLTFTVGAGAIVGGYNGPALTAQVPVTAVEESLDASTASPLTEANLHGSVVTLTLTGRNYERSGFTIGRALTVSGIDGVTVDTFDVERVNDTEVIIELTFSGDFDTDATLTFTVGAGAIVGGYNGPALTAQVPVTAVEESLVASTEFPLTEATLHGSVITFTLTGRNYQRSIFPIEDAVMVSGIEGVTVGSFGVDRVSDTEVTVELTFSGDFDTDATLTLTMGVGAIAEYNGPALTATVPVTAVEESLVVSTEFPLTEATLHGSVVTFTLSGRVYEQSSMNIVRVMTISGIEGIGGFVDRVSDMEVTVELRFNGNINTDTTLTFTVGADAIAGYNQDFTAQVPVSAVAESIVATTTAPLTEATLHGSVVTLTLTGRNYEQQVRSDAVTVSGIEGAAFRVPDIKRVSGTELTVELEFDGTDFDTDATLTFTVSAEAIAGYNEALTAQIPVTAIEESLVASTVSPLTEITLHGSAVTLTLTGRNYEQEAFKIAGALTVSGIDGVTFESRDVERVHNTAVTVELTFRGDFDTDVILTFTVGTGAIADYEETLTAQIAVTATESSNATVNISPSPMLVPAIGEQFTVSLNITNGENIAGYQATVSFDPTALHYVESTNGDYLPADAFFTPPIVKSDRIGETSFGDLIFDRNITLAASAHAGVGNGDGTLATLTFEVIDFKPSTLTLSQLYLVDSDGKRWEATTESGAVTIPPEPAEAISGDINRDGVVNIQDLVIVNVRFSQRGQNSADLNGDGIVNIIDLVLVAGAFGGEAAAPSAQPEALNLLMASEVKQWFSQAQQLALTDPTYLRGVTVLEQLYDSVESERDSAVSKLSESVQPGDVDTLSVGRGRFRDPDHL